jgi:ribosomal protein L11 methyltransferase PrmA
MYSIHDHGVMIADRARTGAYRRALEKVVKPGHVVVDIGAGAGPMAIFACRLGARKVYAIESEEVIELARQVARDNGCAAQIEFIRDLSTNVTLPEKADVIVADVHGALPFYSRGVESLIDARRRFLASNGAMIPLRDRIWAAPVKLPARSYDQVTIWSDRRWDIDLSAGRRFGADYPSSVRLQPKNLVTEPACIATLDYRTLESPSVSGQAWWRAAHDCRPNGFALWFDCDLAEEVSLSAAPGQPVRVFPSRFAPWPQPVAIRQGDRIEAQFCFNLVNGDYIWIWNTRVLSAEGELKREFRQSSLNSMFVTSEKLRKRAAEYRPRLNKSGAAGRAILELIDGQRTHAEIARAVMQRHPEAFANENDALKAVADLSEKYSE